MDNTTPRLNAETDSTFEREMAPPQVATADQAAPESDGLAAPATAGEPTPAATGEGANEASLALAPDGGEVSGEPGVPDAAGFAATRPDGPAASEEVEVSPATDAETPLAGADAEGATRQEPGAGGQDAALAASPETEPVARPTAAEFVAPETDVASARDAEVPPTGSVPLDSPDTAGVQVLPSGSAISEGAVPGSEWATIDEEGNVRQRDGDLYTGRVIGRITGHNPALALAFYARQFDQFAAEAAALEREARAASNPAAYFGRIRRTLEQIPTIDGIGDFDGLIRRLHALESDLRAELDRRRAAKERLAERAEELAVSTDWKATGDELRAMFEEWKSIGTVGREHEQALWERFNTARQAFYTHRSTYFADRERERQANQAMKEELCARAEALQHSTDWKATSDALKKLQAEWKAVGTAGREQDQALWARFRGAMDVFFQARAAHFEANKQAKRDLCAAAEALQDSTDWSATSATLKGLQEQWKQIGFAGGDEDDALWARFRRALDTFYSRRSQVFAERDRAYQENLRQKEALIAEAEELLAAGDLRTATQRVKVLQEQWKAIGPVPREHAEPVWQRFRAVCDAIFNGAREERERRQNLWRSNLKESLERQRAFAKELMEAIARDDELLDRWRGQLESLRPGGREPEIRQDLETKIAAAEARIQQKQRRFEEILTSISELEGRLALEGAR